MAQLTKGAREVVDRLLDLAGAAQYHYAEVMPADTLTDNRALAEAALRDLRDTLSHLRAVIADELPPLLERAVRNKETANVPERLTALETMIAEMRAEIDSLKAQQPPDLRVVRKTGC